MRKDSPDARKKAYRRAQQANSHEDIEKYNNLQKEAQFYFRKAYNNYVEDLSLEMTATQRSYGPSLMQRNVIVAVSPH